MEKLVVVDTNVFSFLIKLKNSHSGRDMKKEKEYLDCLQGCQIVRAFPTEAELRVWLNNLDEGKKKEQYKQGIIEILDQTPSIDGDSKVAAKWAEIITKGRRLGKSHVYQTNNPKRDSQINDTWIAACALAHDLPLVSDNFRDFDWMRENVGLKLICFSQI